MIVGLVRAPAPDLRLAKWMAPTIKLLSDDPTARLGSALALRQCTRPSTPFSQTRTPFMDQESQSSFPNMGRRYFLQYPASALDSLWFWQVPQHLSSDPP